MCLLRENREGRLQPEAQFAKGTDHRAEVLVLVTAAIKGSEQVYMPWPEGLTVPPLATPPRIQRAETNHPLTRVSENSLVSLILPHSRLQAEWALSLNN